MDSSPSPLPPLPPLTVDGHVAEVRSALARRRAAVLTAAPGAGKTTRVPPALVDAGPVLLLQPRRVAARAVARRIADERGWTIGREIGWQIRFEKRFSSATRLLVVTEGVLTARLQDDPLLSSFSTVVFDEFHERSIHTDLGLALARQAWLARDDLRFVVMSATLAVDAVAAFLHDCPVISVPGALHRLDVSYAPGVPVADAVQAVLPRTPGSVLCFLPGAREIERARLALAGQSAHEIATLHGGLDADEQDAAIRATPHRRIILATNLAETSLTVPGVSAVVDSGLVKVASYDAERGIDSLALEKVTLDSADQRAGRAARLGPGVAVRLWDIRDRLRPHREPEINRVDLAGPVLDLLVWGADPHTFAWFERPVSGRIDAALTLLRRLGAIESQRATSLGRAMQRLPLHPRLARLLLAGRGARQAAAACALLSERGRGAGGRASIDFLTAIDAFDREPPHLRMVARDLERLAERLSAAPRAATISETALRHAISDGYADRIAKRRSESPDRYLLASGHGASIGAGAAMPDWEFLAAVDVVAGSRDGVVESNIRAAVRVEAGWIHPTSTAVEHRFDPPSGRVRAVRVERYDAIVLRETPVRSDPAVAASLIRDAWLAREPDDRTTQLLRRLRFAHADVDLGRVVYEGALEARRLDDIDLERLLPFDVKRQLSDRAPASVRLPSGRSATLIYADDGSVSAGVKLQELFGLAESPRIGLSQAPLTLHLLAPNGRPVQTTRDLRSFWERTYPEVRKELRGRYPKHPWPENPWTAPPTHRTKRRS